ncbi:hypothetical protein THRCLA_21542 [Thraustotheca clavata]|uniref:Uncharacterized protein n=1 Tax=Thraustotheca clavata TaxID=74557 RepID=A0A1V9ZVD6_9STRA|nr:hypothetical protein THRCLA_21542 [Thraustotheca clavata]
MADLLSQPGVLLAGAAVVAGVGAYFAMGSSSAPAPKDRSIKKKAPELPKKLKKKKEKEEAAATATPVAPPAETEQLDLEQFVGDFPDSEDEANARAEANRKRNAKKKAAKKKKAATDSEPASASEPEKKPKATKKNKIPRDAVAAPTSVATSSTLQDDGWETVKYKKRGSKANVNA